MVIYSTVVICQFKKKKEKVIMKFKETLLAKSLDAFAAKIPQEHRSELYGLIYQCLDPCAAPGGLSGNNECRGYLAKKENENRPVVKQP